MKKLSILMIVALVTLCLCHSALADVAVGDRGEEVRYLQWLLIQTGYLSGSADGAFGPKTEQAVMDYQTAKGLEPTGVADAELMLEIDRDRVRMDKEAHGQDYYQPYPGDFQPEKTANASAGSHCGMTVLPGIAYRNGCEKHLALAGTARALSAAGDADSLSQAIALWQADVTDQLADAGAPDSVAETWAAAFIAQQDALQATPGDADRQALAMAQNCAQALCELLAGDMPDAADMESIGLTGGGDSCALWSISADKTFITACDAHCTLFDMERDWVKAGAEDAAALQSLSFAWDEALAALYADWSARADGALVEAAQAAFNAALAAQDATFADGAGLLGHMRLTQLESTRLCEMLGAMG